MQNYATSHLRRHLTAYCETLPSLSSSRRTDWNVVSALNYNQRIVPPDFSAESNHFAPDFDIDMQIFEIKASLVNITYITPS